MSGYTLSPKAVRTLKRIVRGNSDATGTTYSPASISEDDFPPPFTVRWSASAYYGAGGWVIWLPDTTKLIYVKDSYKSGFINNIDQESALPTGWRKFRAIASTDTAVWLNILTHTNTGSVTLSFTPSPSSPPTGFSAISLLVATMTSDSQTGAKMVKQFIDSAIVIGGTDGGSSITLDDVSLDWNTNNEAQIKDWDAGTPASATTIAQDINNGGGYGTLVERDSNGALAYKGCGTLAQLLGSSVSLSSQKVLTGLSWSTSNHTLVISSANITVANGVITAWVANRDETISTTNISSIIS